MLMLEDGPKGPMMQVVSDEMADYGFVAEAVSYPVDGEDLVPRCCQPGDDVSPQVAPAGVTMCQHDHLAAGPRGLLMDDVDCCSADIDLFGIGKPVCLLFDCLSVRAK